MELNNDITALVGDTDIYLLDQLMKGRYGLHEKILDAGCGGGRNLHWFVNNGIDITGIDISEDGIRELKNRCPAPAAKNLYVGAIEQMPFADNTFDHIICSAVLHFAAGTSQFMQMMAEMVRVLKTGGTLFIRMTSDIGIENSVSPIGDGVYSIPDGSSRFLLTRALLTECMYAFKLSFLEPLKTVNVADIRCMSTLLLQKQH